MRIENETLIELANRYETPLYVYHGDSIRSKYRTFENAFNVEKLKIHYAVKALSNLSILHLLKGLGAGLDCVSIEEVQLGLKCGYEPENIIYTPNGVNISEYRKAIELGVRITVDNLSILEKLGIESPGTPVFLRFNPHLLAGGNQKISVGHIDSKFGISIHQLPLARRLVKQLNMNVEGIHVHTGSDIIDTDVFARIAALIFDIADEFEGLQSIDFGSGFKVKYRSNDLHTDIEAVGRHFSEAFNNYCEKRNRALTLRFEPGKFLVSESGYFITQVNAIKQTTACTFAAIDSGFNHLIRPMFYGAHHQIENISNPSSPLKMYNVVGYICESDTFAEDRLLNEVREGDLLVFRNAGAYCFSMASNYNSRLRPAEVLMLNGKDHLIRKRETLKDLLVGQQVPDILRS